MAIRSDPVGSKNDIINNSYLGKLTDDQRAAMGVSRPSAPISTGTAVISGSTLQSLRGTPRTPSRISVFASDGNGGFTRSAYDRKTGEDWSVDYGARSPDNPGRWKVLESGPDGTRYENDQTGEVVNVPKGGNLRDVLRGSSERERVAQIQAQGRADAAQIQAQGRAEEQAENKRQFDAKLAAERDAKRDQMRSQFVGNAVQNITKMLKDSGVAEDKIGEMVQSQLSAMLDQYDKAMGGGQGGSPAPQGDGTIVGATGSGGNNPPVQSGAAKTPRTFKPGDVVNGRRWTGSGWEEVAESKGKGGGAGKKTAQPPEEGSEQDLVSKEGRRKTDFKNAGGTYEEDADGNIRYKVANWDYLPQELKDNMPESGNDLDDLALDAQNKANAAKKAFEEKFNNEVKPSIEAEARRKFPNNKAKRDKYVDSEINKWRIKNDPAEARRHKEEAADARWSAIVSG